MDSNLFHKQAQRENETVDEYAQATVLQGVPLISTKDEGDGDGSKCQFVAGLHPDIKEKIVGTEGNLETLLKKRLDFKKSRRERLETEKLQSSIPLTSTKFGSHKKGPNTVYPRLSEP